MEIDPWCPGYLIIYMSVFEGNLVCFVFSIVSDLQWIFLYISLHTHRHTCTHAFKRKDPLANCVLDFLVFSNLIHESIVFLRFSFFYNINGLFVSFVYCCIRLLGTCLSVCHLSIWHSEWEHRPWVQIAWVSVIALSLTEICPWQIETPCASVFSSVK